MSKKTKKLSIYDPAPLVLETLGFNPLEQSVKIAQGEQLTTDHPFLKELLKILNNFKDFPPTAKDLDNLADYACAYLTDSYVPLDIRSKHTIELMSLIHGKKKQIESFIKEDKRSPKLKDLTKKEAETVRKAFPDNYLFCSNCGGQ